MSLRAVLEERAAAAPDRLFVRFDDGDAGVRDYTYREFDAAVNRTANALLRLGVSKGDKLNLHLSNSPRAAARMVCRRQDRRGDSPDQPGLAAGRAGASGEPVRLRGVGDAARSSAGRAGRTGALPRPERCGRHRDDRGLRRRRRIRQNGRGRAGRAAYRRPGPARRPRIMYTSGTTSRPRGALLTHANYVFKGAVVARALGMSADDRDLIALPLIHANAQYHLLAALSAGASAVIARRFSASCFIAQAARHRCTIATLFATPIRMILAQPSRARRAAQRPAPGRLRPEPDHEGDGRLAPKVWRPARPDLRHDRNDGDVGREPTGRHAGQYHRRTAGRRPSPQHRRRRWPRAAAGSARPPGGARPAGPGLHEGLLQGPGGHRRRGQGGEAVDRRSPGMDGQGVPAASSTVRRT